MTDGFTLEKLFKEDIKYPFFYDINLAGIDISKGKNILYEEIKKIFLLGLAIHTKSKQLNVLNVDLVTKYHVELVAKYMLSIGIEVKFKSYTENDIDYLIRGVIYDIEKIPDLSIDVIMDWHTQNIKKTTFILKNHKYLNEMMAKVKTHTEANYFLKVAQPTELYDFPYLINKPTEPGITHAVIFNFAKLSDYPYQHKYVGLDTMHIK